MAHVPTLAATLAGGTDTLTPVRTHSPGPPPFAPGPPDDDGDGGRYDDDGGPRGTPLSNARLGLLIFLGAETMFFAGLVGAFLVYRLANETWPPMAMPRLPVEITGLNTLILLYSAWTMAAANRAMRYGEGQRATRLLLRTALLGVTFLLVQGYEWIKLIRYGLTLSSGVYGATFYTLIGCHGLHVFGAVIWLCSVWRRATHQRYSATRRTGVVLCAMYWSYVVGLWPFLYFLVYLY